jgi:hypothetical protein
MATVSTKPGNAANRIVRFMLDQQAAIECARDYLHNPANLAGNRCGTVMLTGLLVLLAGQKEALDRACDVEPKLGNVRSTYRTTMDDWVSFRHDAAHAADRIFGNSPDWLKNINDPLTSSGAIFVISHDWDSEIVRTGDGRTLRIPEALATSREMVSAAAHLVGLK